MLDDNKNWAQIVELTLLLFLYFYQFRIDELKSFQKIYFYVMRRLLNRTIEIRSKLKNAISMIFKEKFSYCMNNYRIIVCIVVGKSQSNYANH